MKILIWKLEFDSKVFHY